MKYYQDTETGQIYAYEDDFNPFESDIRTIPKTLTDRVKRKKIGLKSQMHLLIILSRPQVSHHTILRGWYI